MESPFAHDVEAVLLIQGKIRVCRLCFKEGEASELINGHDTHFIETASSTYNVTLFDILGRITNVTFQTEELANEFCSKCCQQLLNHYLFSINCLEQETQLHKLINLLNHHTSDCLIIKSEPDIESRSYYLLAFDPLKKSQKGKSKKSKQDTDLPVNGGPCEFCGRMLTTRATLRYHRIVCKNKNKNALPDPDLKFPCDLCEVTFFSKGRLHAHVKNVHIACTVPCEICGKMFKTQNQLQNHLVIHSDERKYKCRFCDNSFKTPNALVYHERIHTGEKPYPCSKCDLCFLSASRRKSHYLAQHCEKSSVCNICFSKFSSNCRVRQHMKKVHFKVPKKSARSPFKISENNKVYIKPIIRLMSQNELS